MHNTVKLNCSNIFQVELHYDGLKYHQVNLRAMAQWSITEYKHHPERLNRLDTNHG